MKVLVFGTFDLVHPGHRFLFAEAAKRGHLTIIVARDRNVQRIKGRFPVQDEDERMSHVRMVVPDAEVILGDAHDFLVPVRAIDPDLIMLGYDQELPPGVTEADLPCDVQRAAAFEPETYKSSLLRDNKTVF
jgi:FAD synthetase